MDKRNFKIKQKPNEEKQSQKSRRIKFGTLTNFRIKSKVLNKLCFEIYWLYFLF